MRMMRDGRESKEKENGGCERSEGKGNRGGVEDRRGGDSIVDKRKERNLLLYSLTSVRAARSN